MPCEETEQVSGVYSMGGCPRRKKAAVTHTLEQGYIGTRSQSVGGMDLHSVCSASSCLVFRHQAIS